MPVLMYSNRLRVSCDCLLTAIGDGPTAVGWWPFGAWHIVPSSFGPEERTGDLKFANLRPTNRKSTPTSVVEDDDGCRLRVGCAWGGGGAPSSAFQTLVFGGRCLYRLPKRLGGCRRRLMRYVRQSELVHSRRRGRIRLEHDLGHAGPLRQLREGCLPGVLCLWWRSYSNNR